MTSQTRPETRSFRFLSLRRQDRRTKAQYVMPHTPYPIFETVERFYAFECYGGILWELHGGYWIWSACQPYRRHHANCRTSPLPLSVPQSAPRTRTRERERERERESLLSYISEHMHSCWLGRWVPDGL
ncbi:hypothetical protein LY76DRAFT_294866 [Colletotrichum caudatum]|nr:hypothetical protein LY76DRAFT_294866 [Colletotrichum caudatum]